MFLNLCLSVRKNGAFGSRDRLARGRRQVEWGPQSEHEVTTRKGGQDHLPPTGLEDRCIDLRDLTTSEGCPVSLPRSDVFPMFICTVEQCYLVVCPNDYVLHFPGFQLTDRFRVFEGFCVLVGSYDFIGSITQRVFRTRRGCGAHVLDLPCHRGLAFLDLVGRRALFSIFLQTIVSRDILPESFPTPLFKSLSLVSHSCPAASCFAQTCRCLGN